MYRESRKVRILDATVQRLAGALDNGTERKNKPDRHWFRTGLPEIKCWPLSGTYAITEEECCIYHLTDFSWVFTSTKRSRKQKKFGAD